MRIKLAMTQLRTGCFAQVSPVQNPLGTVLHEWLPDVPQRHELTSQLLQFIAAPVQLYDYL